MTLTNPKPAGFAFGEVFTSTAANSICTQLPYAIDGNGGGSYTPSAAITIGGSGLTLTAAPTLSPVVTVVRLQPLTPLFNEGNAEFGGAQGWTWDGGAGRWEGLGDNMYLPLANLVDNSTLTSVTVRVNGTSAGASATLYIDNNAGGLILLDSQADAGSGARDLTITLASPQAIDLSTAPRALYVALQGLTSGYQVHRMTATFSCSKVNP